MESGEETKRVSTVSLSLCVETQLEHISWTNDDDFLSLSLSGWTSAFERAIEITREFGERRLALRGGGSIGHDARTDERAGDFD